MSKQLEKQRRRLAARRKQHATPASDKSRKLPGSMNRHKSMSAKRGR